MPSYHVTVPSSKPASTTFAYLAAFDNIRDWDPSVVSARRLDEGELRVGSAFDVVVRMRRGELPLRYEVVRLDPAAIALEATARWFRSYDVITVAAAGEGSVATYDALLELKGLAKAATPLVSRAFEKLGDAAAEGLRRELA